jgi:V8-like Glu-specific endopeptidase
LNLKAVSFEKIIKEIQLVGFPFPSIGKNLSFAEGKIRTRYRRYEKQHYDITALIRQGNSGGPVLDKDFQVVGVAKEGELQDHGNNGVLQVQEVIKLNEIYVGIFGPPDPNTPKMFW